MFNAYTIYFLMNFELRMNNCFTYAGFFYCVTLTYIFSDYDNIIYFDFVENGQPEFRIIPASCKL